MPSISNLDNDKRMDIERCKLLVDPNPNSKVANNNIDMIIDIFWKELGHFQKKTGVHELHQDKFLLPDVLNGNSLL